MTTDNALIRLEGLGKVFYTDEVETHALSDIHLEIKKGEYIAICFIPQGTTELPDFEAPPPSGAPAASGAPQGPPHFVLGTPLGPGGRKNAAFTSPRSRKFTLPSPFMSSSGSLPKKPALNSARSGKLTEQF